MLATFFGFIFIAYPSDAQPTRRPSTTQNPQKPKQPIIKISKPENEFTKVILTLYNTYKSTASHEVVDDNPLSPRTDSAGCNNIEMAKAKPRPLSSELAPIDYCPGKMKNLLKLSQGDSLPIYFIFAHELSHHILQHTSGNCKTDKNSDSTQYNPCQKYELAADALALWLISLKRLNSHSDTLTQDRIINMLTFISKVDPDLIKGDIKHPSLAARWIGLKQELQEINSSQKTLYILDDVIRKCKTFQTKAIETEQKFIINSEISSLADSPLTTLERFWESTRESNSLLTARSTFDRVETELKNVQSKLDTIRRNKIDDVSTNEKVAMLHNHYEVIKNKLNNIRNLYFTYEAIGGIGIVNGTLIKNNRPLNKQFYPVYSAGVRLSRQNWQKPLFCSISLDLTANYSQLDIHQLIEDQIKTVERISRIYFQGTPRIGAGYHLRGYSGDGVENKLTSDFLSLSAGIPFRLGGYQYHNFLTGQQDDAMHISSNDIDFSNFSKPGNFYQKIVSTNLFDFSNFAFQFSFHHSNRIGNGKRWNKIKKYSSYSIAVAYQRSVLKIKQGKEEILNRFNVYEITLGYRWWR